jgi:hypothetical protein
MQYMNITMLSRATGANDGCIQINEGTIFIFTQRRGAVRPFI